MKIVVTDPCIFIDVCDLKIDNALFRLGMEFHTSLDVFHEISKEYRQNLYAYKLANKLHIHHLNEENRFEIQKKEYPLNFCNSEKTAIYVAEKIDAVILSGERIIRSYAKEKAIEYHGILWIFDQLIEAKLISANESVLKLESLIASNKLYEYNTDLVKGFQKRKKEWSRVTVIT